MTDDAARRRRGREIGFPVLLKPSRRRRRQGHAAWCATEAELRRRDRRGPPRGRAARSATTRCSSSGTSADSAAHRGAGARPTPTATSSTSASASASLQRRHQKVIEEAPSPLLDAADRAAAMGEAAVEAARACGYTGAGTVEFIVDARRPGDVLLHGDEHPAAGRAPGHRAGHRPRPGRAAAAGRGRRAAAARPGATSRLDGHAIEARVYAEDPARGFLPAGGHGARRCASRPGAGVRVDSALRRGTVVGTDYDPMLAKVIAWGPDRATALRPAGRRAGRDRRPRGDDQRRRSCARCSPTPTCVAGQLDTGLIERRGDGADRARAAAAARLRRRGAGAAARGRARRPRRRPVGRARRLAARRAGLDGPPAAGRRRGAGGGAAARPVVGARRCGSGTASR